MAVAALFPQLELPKLTNEEIELEFLPSFQRPFKTAPYLGEIYNWAKDFVELPSSYSPSGPFDVSISKYLVEPFEAIRDPNIRQVNIMAPPRSGKTLVAEITLLYLIANSPGNILWVQSTEATMKKMGDARMAKLLNLCEPVAKLLDPNDRYAVTQKRYRFANGIEVHLASATLKSLQSFGYKYIVFDEVWMADAGLIAEAQARIGDYPNTYKIILISQGGSPTLGVDWTVEFNRAPIKEYGFSCPQCNKPQLYSFNERRDDLTYGGLQWKRNETTCPNDVWIPEEASKTAAVECLYSECKHKIDDTPGNRDELEKRSHYITTKAKGDPSKVSFRYNDLAVRKVAWSTLSKEFLEAINLQRFTGNDSLREVFEQKRLAISYGSKLNQQLVNLNTFDIAPDADWTEKGIPFLTVDIQEKSPRFWYVVRAWASNGDSWKLGHGNCDTWAELDNIRTKFSVKITRVLVDSGNKPREDHIYSECAKAGYWGVSKGQKVWFCYRACKGSGNIAFKHSESDWRPYSKIEYQRVNVGDDPKYKGIPGAPLIVWSNYRIKQMLEHLRDGKGAKWLSNDKDPEYQKQLASEYCIKEIKNNKVSYRYVKVNDNEPNEYWDLEALQVLAACMCGLLNVGNKK